MACARSPVRAPPDFALLHAASYEKNSLVCVVTVSRQWQLPHMMTHMRDHTEMLTVFDFLAKVGVFFTLFELQLGCLCDL